MGRGGKSAKMARLALHDSLTSGATSQLDMHMLIGILHFDKSSKRKPKRRKKLMEITSEDIRAIQHKLDSLRKMRKAATSAKLPSASKLKGNDSKLENDVFDSEKFFDAE